MVYPLKDKVIVITGGANGIGEAVVHCLVDEHVKAVSILDVDESSGRNLQSEINSKRGKDIVTFIKCDVSNDKSLEDAFKAINGKHGYVDVVINNAGIADETAQHYERLIDINFKSVCQISLRALEWMRQDKNGRGGTIINVSSIRALFPSPAMPIYGGCKTAVLVFSNSIGMVEYESRTGVRVVTVCFGVTGTAMIDTIKNFDDHVQETIMPQLKAIFKGQTPQSAGRGLVEVYKNAKSGSTWLVTGDQPVLDISDDIKQAYDILAKRIY